MFEINEGPKDRRSRGILGIAILLVACLVLTGWLQIVVSIFGIGLIFTAITGFCALYRVFKISTHKKNKE